MRRSIFEAVQPVCPVCKRSSGKQNPVHLGRVTKENESHVLEAILICTDPACQREYPVIDGIPILICEIRRYLSENVFQVCQNREFSPEIASILNDCCGQGSALDTLNQHLSSYGWDHYAEFDPSENPGISKPGMVSRVLQRGMDLLGDLSPNLILDIGCSVGRTSFDLASRYRCPTLGIDMNFSMLRMAAETLRHHVVRYPRRRIGLVYDHREFPVSFEQHDQGDFWACDAIALPFRDHQFDLAVSLNTMDCVQSPMDFLRSLSTSLTDGGKVVLACPYDWTSSVTPIEGWLGGHSQRGPDQGAAEPVLRRLLDPQFEHAIEGLCLTAEEEIDWQVRLHDRSTVTYRNHLVTARRVSTR